MNASGSCGYRAIAVRIPIVTRIYDKAFRIGIILYREAKVAQTAFIICSGYVIRAI